MRKHILFGATAVALATSLAPTAALADGYYERIGSGAYYAGHAAYGHSGYHGSYGPYGSYGHHGHSGVNVGSAIALGVGLAVAGAIISQANQGYYGGAPYGYDNSGYSDGGYGYDYGYEYGYDSGYDDPSVR